MSVSFGFRQLNKVMHHLYFILFLPLFFAVVVAKTDRYLTSEISVTVYAFIGWPGNMETINVFSRDRILLLLVKFFFFGFISLVLQLIAKEVRIMSMEKEWLANHSLSEEKLLLVLLFYKCFSCLFFKDQRRAHCRSWLGLFLSTRLLACLWVNHLPWCNVFVMEWRG